MAASRNDAVSMGVEKGSEDAQEKYCEKPKGMANSCSEVSGKCGDNSDSLKMERASAESKTQDFLPEAKQAEMSGHGDGLELTDRAHDPTDESVVSSKEEGGGGDGGEGKSKELDFEAKEAAEINEETSESRRETRGKEEDVKEKEEVDEGDPGEDNRHAVNTEAETKNKSNESTAVSHGAHGTVSHGVHSKTDTKVDKDVVKWPWKTNARTVPEVVDEVWAEIDDLCHRFPLSKSGQMQALRGWKVIRLFVSSTFHDFQNEREILVKKVFPELKEWCARRSIYFIECDLRWGVPRDSTTRTVLCTCMEEIDRCHEDTEGEAFFLNMLGKRYGWIPTKDDVPEDIGEKYDWIPNTSITHMEIMHGAYRFCNRNAVFFLREIEGMPVDVGAKFADPTDLGLAHIERLKTKLKSRFPEQCRTYTCQYDPSYTNCVKLVGLNKFGQDVLDFYKFAIERKYPVECTALTPEEQENERQLLYMAHKGQLVFGREWEIAFLMEYVTGKGDYDGRTVHEAWNAQCCPKSMRDRTVDAIPDEKQADKKDEDVTSEETQRASHPPVAMVAKSGQGKSSLMARFVMEAKQEELNVFFHLIGCSGDSMSLTGMLVRLCRYLANGDEERIADLKDMCTGTVITLYKSLLRDYMESGKQLLIIIDDLSQLQQDDTAWSDWIPASLEGGVHMVFSLVEGSWAMSGIQEKVPTIQFLDLGQLGTCARVDIVENYFAQYNKKLDPEQLDLLTRSKGAENALWLALACEELRVFGAFEALTALIRNMPDSLEGLVSDILERLVAEDETGLVEKTLCYLECSMKGLTESEMQCLLGDFETQTSIPMLHWAMVRRTLKPFLRRISGMCKLECLTFFHHAIGQVVSNKWLTDTSQFQKYHSAMADYYQNWYNSGSEAYKANHVAFHLSKSNDRNLLFNFIRKDKLSRHLGPVLKSKYLKACRCQTMINTHGPFHTQLFICNFCTHQRQAFGHEVWPNGECCVLCGNFVPPIYRKGPNIAYRCQRHPPKGPRLPGAKTCLLCSRMIMKGQERPVYLCQFCQMGGFPTCCNLNGVQQ